MSLPETATDVAALTKLAEEQETINTELLSLYEQWEALSWHIFINLIQEFYIFLTDSVQENHG